MFGTFGIIIILDFGIIHIFGNCVYFVFYIFYMLLRATEPNIVIYCYGATLTILRNNHQVTQAWRRMRRVTSRHVALADS